MIFASILVSTVFSFQPESSGGGGAAAELPPAAEPASKAPDPKLWPEMDMGATPEDWEKRADLFMMTASWPSDSDTMEDWTAESLAIRFAKLGLVLKCESQRAERFPTSCETTKPTDGHFLDPEIISALLRIKKRRLEDDAIEQENARAELLMIARHLVDRRSEVTAYRAGRESVETTSGKIRTIERDFILVDVDGADPIRINVDDIVSIRKRRFLTSEFWCSDAMTMCWNERSPILSGLRILIEPTFNFSIGKNREGLELKAGNIVNAVALGIETNIVGAWLSAQAFMISPHITEIEKIDDADTLQTANVLVKAGFATGVSILSGSLGVGYGFVSFAENSLPNFAEGRDKMGFFYVSLQPISIIRSVFTAAKGRKKTSSAPVSKRYVSTKMRQVV